MDLMQSINISAGGMYAQSSRMKVAAENIANADSAQDASGNGAYHAKQIFFKSVLNKQTGLTEVQVSKVAPDMQSPMRTLYQPGNPLADAKGFVTMPNVDATYENINMKEAQRSYEANLAAIETAKDMMGRTLDILK